MVMSAKVLIVDDDPDMRALIRTMLETETDLVCADASDAFHALEAWYAEHHEVVTIDQRMPGLMGLELARVLLDEDPQQLVILVSAYVHRGILDAAEELGIPVVAKDQLRVLPRVIDAHRR